MLDDRLSESDQAVPASAAASLLDYETRPTEPRVEWAEVKKSMESNLVT